MLTQASFRVPNLRTLDWPVCSDVTPTHAHGIHFCTCVCVAQITLLLIGGGRGGAFITEETSRVSSVIKTLPVSGFWHAGIYYHFNNPGKTANQCSVN